MSLILHLFVVITVFASAAEAQDDAINEGSFIGSVITVWMFIHFRPALTILINTQLSTDNSLRHSKQV